MIAAILAGGLGTRLRPMVDDRPKVLATVRDRPFLAYVLDQIADAEVRKVVICSGYRGEAIPEVFGSQFRDMKLHYSRELHPLGTAGALRQAVPFFDSDLVLVMNGDSYCDVEMEKFKQWHRAQRATASIALAEVEDISRFGSVRLAADGKILGFAEKGRPGKGWINAGIYLLPVEWLKSLPEGVPTSLEHDCFPNWAGKNFYGFAQGSRFFDIGTPESYRSADEFFSNWRIRNGTSVIDSHRKCNFKSRYVILDRDGTLNVEKNYLSDPRQLELLPGATEGLGLLQSRDFGIVVVTNQSGIGRGYFSEDGLEQIHQRLLNLLNKQGITLDRIYYCPHDPADHCACRKPEPGLVWQAAAELGFDPHQAFVVGDKPCDIEMGRRVGATTVLVRTGYGAQFSSTGACQPDYVAQNLVEAANLMVDLAQGRKAQEATATQGGRKRDQRM
jgi:D-glycero-alpha-D-manno-heptose 1-phosphate guanylyltransferase